MKIMTTKTTEMQIESVKLIGDGIGGLKVTYKQTESRNGRDFITKSTDNKTYPIHHELEETFGWLKGYLLDICNYSSNPEERASLLESTEISGITYSDKGFIITGKLTTINNKVFPLNTPLITEDDGYGDFDAVTKILDAIYTETKEYLGGSKVISDQQYVLKLNKDNKDFDVNTFNNLSNEEQFKIANEYMAKNKFLVVPMDIIEEEETDLHEIVQSAIETPPSVEDSVSGLQTKNPKNPKETKVIQLNPNEVVTSKVKMQEVDGDVIVDILTQPVAVKQKKAK